MRFFSAIPVLNLDGNKIYKEIFGYSKVGLLTLIRANQYWGSESSVEKNHQNGQHF